MPEDTTRRALLATTGAAVASLAGCAGVIGSEPPGGPGTGTETQTDRTEPTSTATGPEATSTASPTAEAAFSRGKVLEDFEKLDDWGTIAGSMSAETKDPYVGSQALRVKNKGDSAGVFTAFPDGLDLTKFDLSVALKLKSPKSGRLSVDFFAPGEENHALSRRYLPKGLNDWVRFDLGYVNEPGKPDMSNVQSLRFVVHGNETGSNPDFVIDDLRLLPKTTKNGKVVLTFDDSFESHYDVAYQEMKKRGWKGVLGTIPSEIGKAGRLDVGQLRTLRDEGWDIAAHPQKSNPTEPLPSMSKDKQREVIEKTNHLLKVRGFPNADQQFITPFDKMNDATLEIVRDVYDVGFIFGACNNATKPSGRHMISRVYGASSSLHGAWRQVKLANRRDQLVVLAFHGIGPNGETSVKDFKSLLDTIEKTGMEVITASDLAAKY